MLKPLFVWQNDILQKVNPQDIIYIYSKGGNTRIYLLNKTCYIVRSTLSQTLKKLPAGMFIKVDPDIAVSAHFIDGMDKERNVIIAGEPIPIAKTHYKSVIGQLNIMG